MGGGGGGGGGEVMLAFPYKSSNHLSGTSNHVHSYTVYIDLRRPKYNTSLVLPSLVDL